MDPQNLPLRDIHLPDAVAWWPLAPGWWVVAGVLVIAIAGLLFALYRHHKLAFQRAALSELDRLIDAYERDHNQHHLAASISRLLRSVAVHLKGTAVASVQLQSWHQLTDQRALPPVPRPVCEWLTHAAYSPASHAERERVSEILDGCRDCLLAASAWPQRKVNQHV